MIDFVREHTSVEAPALVPEIRLRLAAESVPLWERMEELGGGDPQPPPFWAFAWAGGQALARYLLDHPHLVAGRTVLDLASGGGVVAIAAAIAGAADVRACEIDPFAVAAIGENAAANGVTVRAELADVLGDTPVAVPVGGPVGAGGGLDDVEVVLAGDVFYSREMSTRMLSFLDRAADRGATVLVGDPGRAYLPRERFTEVARYDVPVTRELEDSEIKSTAVLSLRTR